MNMKEKYEQARKYLNSKTLYSNDFKGTTTIYHSDRSVFKYNFSIMEEKKDFIYVWTEHNGYHFYYVEDLYKVEYSREIYCSKRNIIDNLKQFIESNNIKDSFDIDEMISPPDDNVDEYTINELLKDCCEKINYGKEEK